MTAALVVIAFILAVLAMVLQIANLHFAALIAAGLGTVVAITDTDGPGTALAAVLGVSLLLSAEFGFWSMEMEPGQRYDVPAIVWKLGGIGILAGSALALGLITALIADSNVHGNLLTTGVAAVAAVLVLIIALIWSRKVPA